MADESKSAAKSAAILSVLAPVAAFALSGAASALPTPTREMKLLCGGAATLFTFIGFVLAIVALAANLRHKRKGVTALAAVGLGINGLCLLGFILLIPALQRVVRMRTTGYTLDQMRAMPQAIPGSRAILNEALGFRLEIPGGFVENPQPQPERVFYAFLRLDNNEPAIDRKSVV